MWPVGSFVTHGAQVGKTTTLPDSNFEVKVVHADGTSTDHVNVTQSRRANRKQWIQELQQEWPEGSYATLGGTACKTITLPSNHLEVKVVYADNRVTDHVNVTILE